ncbi:uncharacterized protein LOC110237252 [Exaiptasia diaphana]|uniref:EGF-like domain-containing protein n=1 Tax=Exaiptasia diaphana TaxID=2652724 RepID=A0A913X4N7_EXADI|nr:uncharacterized protein LOC110237252 [Exaiptasia diaphana]
MNLHFIGILFFVLWKIQLSSCYGCDINPCQNGGSCRNVSGDYNCTCNKSWQGKHCEQDVDECLTSPCKNQGMCLNSPGSYMCGCISGWKGHNCDQDVDECLTRPCKNEGKCLNFPGSYICRCMPGWKGHNCDQDVDECSTYPGICQNHEECYNIPGSFICRCHLGWKAQTCPRAIIYGSSIPGQGYVYYMLPRTPYFQTKKRQVLQILKERMTWTDFQKTAKVACKTAGYIGPFSPSLPGYFDKNALGHSAYMLIRSGGCSGDETSLIACSYTLLVTHRFSKYRLKVNCLPPNRSHMHGVSYNLWKGKLLPSDVSSWKLASIYQNKPMASHILPSFDVNFRVYPYLCIKLSGYLMVNRPGMYSIAATCKDGCEVWWKRVEEQGLDDDGSTASMIIKLKSTLIPNAYERSPEQIKSMHIGCHFYHLEVYTSLLYELNMNKFTNLAIRSHDDGRWSAPIPSKFLYWYRPGERKLYFNVTNSISSRVNLGSQLLIEALYKFCCVGVKCPSCPLTLYLNALGHSILVNRSLQMNCVQLYH